MTPASSSRRLWPLVLAVAAMVPASAVAATLQRHTLSAWEAYVAATEARIARELSSPHRFLVTDFLPDGPRTRSAVVAGRIAVGEMITTTRAGGAIDVPDGWISHWRGSVFLRGVDLDVLLGRLQHPSERGPHQQEVLALRLLERKPDHLRLFIRMTRSNVVTVTYDTEHRVDLRRHGPMRASSRSVSTRIVELEDAGTAGERRLPEGEDRGFLWRLNSYWRYEQVGDGVLVELESLTLSRGVPSGVRFVVEPIVERVARESIEGTLAALRLRYAPPATRRGGRVS